MLSAKWLLVVTAASLFAIQSHGEGGIRLPDQPPLEDSVHPVEDPIVRGRNGDRQGRDLLDWIGLGTGPDQDPYLARTNQACLSGDLAECFKSQALSSLGDFFNKESYSLSERVSVVRMPETQLRSLIQEPYEYSTESRAEDSEWDGLVKFAMRKVERFLKSAAFEIDIDESASEGGRYSPRFINEIADEIDVLEDKKAPLFKKKSEEWSRRRHRVRSSSCWDEALTTKLMASMSQPPEISLMKDFLNHMRYAIQIQCKLERNKLKKLFIPMLLILKLFKLKLLLFLPLILGLASFKKLLGFAAIIIPGLIGYFKLCKPNLSSPYGGYGQDNYYNRPQYSSAGLGIHPYGDNIYSHQRPQGGFYGRQQEGNIHHHHNSGGVAFRDDVQDAQDLAYQGWEYRNSKSLKEDEKSSE